MAHSVGIIFVLRYSITLTNVDCNIFSDTFSHVLGDVSHVCVSQNDHCSSMAEATLLSVCDIASHILGEHVPFFNVLSLLCCWFLSWHIRGPERGIIVGAGV